MATLLDIGLLKGFSSIFPFLFVLVVMWAVLLRVKLFSSNKAFAAMVAFLAAIAVMFSPIAIKTINLMAPWFVLLFIGIVFVMITYQVFGIKEDAILGVLTGQAYGENFGWAMLAIVGLIMLGSLFTVLTEENVQFRAGENVTLTDQTPIQYFTGIVTHPKVLGFIVIMLIALFTMQRLLEK